MLGATLKWTGDQIASQIGTRIESVGPVNSVMIAVSVESEALSPKCIMLWSRILLNLLRTLMIIIKIKRS